MKISLEDYCSTIVKFYTQWRHQYTSAIEDFTLSLKEIDEHLYCSYVSFNLTPFGTYTFNITNINVNLFSPISSFSSCGLILEKNKEGKIINRGYKGDSFGFPDADKIFFQCYDKINKIFEKLEEFHNFSMMIKPIIPLNRVWLINRFDDSYGYNFTISVDSYGLRKRIEFYQEDEWIPIFKQYDYETAQDVKSNLRQYFKISQIEVDDCYKVYFEKPKVIKNKPWYYRLFNRKG